MKPLTALQKNLTKVLILNSPNNPTGHVYLKHELEELASVCRDNQILVLNDFIYGFPEDFSGRPVYAMSSFLPEQTMVTSGLSKIFGAGGWRLGFAALPSGDSWRTFSSALSSLMSETISGVQVPTQRAAMAAYREKYLRGHYLWKANSLHKIATRYVWDRLLKLGAHCSKPEGGFYVFPSFKSHQPRLLKRGIRSGQDLVVALQEIGFYALAGECFGMPPESLSLHLLVSTTMGQR